MKLTLLDRDSKIPPKGRSWKRGMTDDPEQHAHWLAEGYNVGLPLEENGRVALDFDDKDAARNWYRKHRDLCTVIVETRRGAHFHFSGQTNTRPFEEGDLIKGNGYVVFPTSTVEGWTYKLHEFGPLQEFPEHLFPAKEKGATTITRDVRDAIRYVMAIESIQDGSSNRETSSRGLVRACSVLRDAGLSEAETTIRMLEWNNGPTVSPPWKPEEIARAVTNVFRKGGKS